MPFILDGLESEAYDRKYKDSDLLKRIGTYFGRRKGRMTAIVATLVLASAAGIATPILISKGVDLLTRSSAVSAILILVAALLVAGVLSWLFNYLRQYLTALVTGDAVLALRQDVFQNAIRQDLAFFDEFSSGKIVSRIDSDTQDFSNVVSLIIEVVEQIFMVLVLLVWLFVLEWRLALILVAIMPIAFAVALGFRATARRVSLKARQVTARINSLIKESISGIIVAKNFRQEKAVYADFLTHNKDAYRAGLVRGLILNVIFPVLGITSGIGIAILVYSGGLSVQAGTITAGTWFLFMQTAGMIWYPLMSIASFWSQFQDGLAAAERVFALMDTQPKVKQTGAVATEKLTGLIEFRNVGFSYKEDEPVLDDFSLTLGAKEKLAVVGHTGAGKSSLAKLILRFYEFQSGEILIDGKDIRSLDLDAYRKHVGYVPQDPYLFPGTVRDNIRYGRPDATEDEVMDAVRHIAGGDWIDDLAKGLDTDTGSRGSQLSMGQRQLVALTRVLLCDPAIFVLDEATASVDPFTEEQIQEGLETLMKERTAVVIAHRLSTVKNSDRIIVLERGKILEQGKHDDLMSRGGHYAGLYNTYFRHQSLDYVEHLVKEI